MKPGPLLPWKLVLVLAPLLLLGAQWVDPGQVWPALRASHHLSKLDRRINSINNPVYAAFIGDSRLRACIVSPASDQRGAVYKPARLPGLRGRRVAVLTAPLMTAERYAPFVERIIALRPRYLVMQAALFLPNRYTEHWRSLGILHAPTTNDWATVARIWRAEAQPAVGPSFDVGLSIVDRAHAAGITVFVVDVPTAASVDPLVPHRYFEERQDLLRPALEARGVPYLALAHERWDDADFRDFRHLQLDGRMRWEARFGQHFRGW